MVHELVLSHVEAPEGDPGGGALSQAPGSRPRSIQLANISYSALLSSLISSTAVLMELNLEPLDQYLLPLSLR
jgi:hypothetical protein